MELLQQTLAKRMPSAASRSMVGVGQYFLSHEPYAPMASEAWSSDMMKRILGPFSLACRLVPARMPSWHAKVIRIIFRFCANGYITYQRIVFPETDSSLETKAAESGEPPGQNAVRTPEGIKLHPGLPEQGYREVAQWGTNATASHPSGLRGIPESTLPRHTSAFSSLPGAPDVSPPGCWFPIDLRSCRRVPTCPL